MNNEPSVPPSGPSQGESDKPDQAPIPSTEPIDISEAPGVSETPIDPASEETRSWAMGPEEMPGTDRPSAPADGGPAPGSVGNTVPLPEGSSHPEQSHLGRPDGVLPSDTPPSDTPPADASQAPSAGGGALGWIRTAGVGVLAAIVAGIVLLSASAGFAAGRLTGSSTGDSTAAGAKAPGPQPYGDDQGGPAGGFPGDGQGQQPGNALIGQVTAVDGQTITVRSHGGDITVTITDSTEINGEVGADLSTLQDEFVVVEGTKNEDGTVTAASVETRAMGQRGQRGGLDGSSTDSSDSGTAQNSGGVDQTNERTIAYTASFQA